MANFVQKLDPSHIDHHLTKEQDDIHCDPPSGINVLIIGAGVGGLVAALECHRKGHNVRIWERSESAVAGGELRALPFLRPSPQQTKISQATCSPSASAAASSSKTTQP
jgi:heterodisulfide reductase subunit A-like polyferredoxin